MALMLAHGCSGSGDTGPMGRGAYGEDCIEGCASSVCGGSVDGFYGLPGPPTGSFSFCSELCESDADCPPGEGEAMVGGTWSDGTRVCSASCSGDDLWFISRMDRGGSPTTGPFWYCIDGRPVMCEQTPCGCTCPVGTYCDPAAGCVPSHPVGSPCRHDLWCQSFNCSAEAWDPEPGACLVGRGEPCTDADCELCVTGPDRTYCSEPCTGQLACDVNTGCDFRSEQCMPACNTDADCTPPWDCNPMYDFDRVTIIYRVCGP